MDGTNELVPVPDRPSSSAQTYEKLNPPTHDQIRAPYSEPFGGAWASGMRSEQAGQNHRQTGHGQRAYGQNRQPEGAAESRDQRRRRNPQETEDAWRQREYQSELQMVTPGQEQYLAQATGAVSGDHAKQTGRGTASHWSAQAEELLDSGAETEDEDSEQAHRLRSGVHVTGLEEAGTSWVGPGNGDREGPLDPRDVEAKT